MSWVDLVQKALNIFKKGKEAVDQIDSKEQPVSEEVSTKPLSLEEYLRSLMFIKQIKKNNTDDVKKGIKALQFELRNNPSLSHFGYEGKIDGVESPELLNIVEKMWEDPSIPVVSKVNNPDQANDQISSIMKTSLSKVFPNPLALAVLKQETHWKWFRSDGYPTVGLDFNNKSQPYVITSRGLFLSQRTIFNYPFPQESLDSFDSVSEDLKFVINALDLKYKRYVVSADVRARDDLRFKSFGDQPLRGCKYEQSDERFMKDCKNCVWSGKLKDYKEGKSLIDVPGKWVLKPSIYHRNKDYLGYPDYEDFPCDYVYAIRRYNGSGVNSFHYLMRVLDHLRKID